MAWAVSSLNRMVYRTVGCNARYFDVQRDDTFGAQARQVLAVKEQHCAC
jgi:hypothetical protein